MTLRNRAVVVLATAMLITSCSTGRSGPPAEVSGTVTYRERIALVPGTQLRVTLSETTRADAPAQFIAETTVPDVMQVPIPFRITFPGAWIDPKLTYTLRARIEREGRLLFTNDAQVRVLTGGAPSHVEIVVVSAGGARN
jgi:putative lipoprotein